MQLQETSFKANGLAVEWIECLRNCFFLCRLKHTNQTYQHVLINLILTVNLKLLYESNWINLILYWIRISLKSLAHQYEMQLQETPQNVGHFDFQDGRHYRLIRMFSEYMYVIYHFEGL
jgi:hypothetical protein